NPDLVRPGGLHWITAGRGMVHEELPIEPGKTVHGLQVFVALPRGGRDITPYPLSIEPEDVPLIEGEGFDVRVPVGHYADASSPLEPPTNVTLLDIALDENAGLNVPIAAGHSFFALPITGTVEIAGQPFNRDSLDVPVIRAQHSPRTLEITAQQGGAEVVVFSAPAVALL
ncbi:MAG: pirin family protein, partial [Lautropia sp.]|nr:pirin family protein [Lautropia sp.]